MCEEAGRRWTIQAGGRSLLLLSAGFLVCGAALARNGASTRYEADVQSSAEETQKEFVDMSVGLVKDIA